jgi:GNAT superfamily N-acetyltransferase
MTADGPRLARAIAATWPPAHVACLGPFVLADGAGGGNRVSAARLRDAASDGAEVSEADVAGVTARQRSAGQSPLFMVFDWQARLDARLSHMNLVARDETLILAGAARRIAAEPPPVTCFDIWPPLAVQEDIWAAGGIGRARLAVMGRVQGPRTSLLGRIEDRPAGTAFVAIHDGIAMVHALEVSPRARRKGLGRTMMRAAAFWALGQGADIFATLVTRQNGVARGLYAELAMRPAGHYLYRAMPGEAQEAPPR